MYERNGTRPGPNPGTTNFSLNPTTILFKRERNKSVRVRREPRTKLYDKGTIITLRFFSSPIARFRKLVLPSPYAPVTAMTSGCSKHDFGHKVFDNLHTSQQVLSALLKWKIGLD